MISMFRREYAQLPIFAGLDDDQINHLSHFLVERALPKDRMIFEQGQPAECLFILLTGEVVIRYKPYDGPPLTVAKIKPGGVFGWSAALGRNVYTSGAVAVQDSLAFRLRGTNLAVISARYPNTGKILLERLASVIAERLRNPHAQVLEMLSQRVIAEKQFLERETKNDRK